MTELTRWSGWLAALGSGMLLAGCAPESEFSTVSTSPTTMVCDGGRTFTVSYGNGFETAMVEAGGQRFELERLYSATADTPTRRAGGPRAGGMFDRGETGFGSRNVFERQRNDATAAGPVGVRYGNDEALFISRNQTAVLQVGDDIYSNCAVART